MEATNILEIFGYWQFAVCLFAGLGLLAIWWHIGRLQDDFGQVWLALSVFCWSISGLVEVLFANNDQGKMINLVAWRSILSLFNSLFILLALPWFRNVPLWLSPLVKHKFWPLVIGLPFLFSLLPTISALVTGSRSGFIGELDVYYALLTLVFLGAVLWTSFRQRRLPFLAWLSVVCILITLVAQAYKFSLQLDGLVLFSAIFKTNLIMLFFALALSWVKELSEAAVLPGERRLSLKLISSTSAKEKNKVVITGLANFARPVSCPLTPASFQLLQTFVHKRQDANLSGGWLEIKPKNVNRNGVVYDISDHNQIKRLLINLADGIYGKDNWSKDLHLIPLREALFEPSPNQERKIRLALPADRLSDN